MQPRIADLLALSCSRESQIRLLSVAAGKGEILLAGTHAAFYDRIVLLILFAKVMSGKWVRPHCSARKDFIMGKYKVIITDCEEYDNIDNEMRILEGIGAEVLDVHTRDEDRIIALARDCDGLITQFAPITRRVINSMERCKVISKYATGTDNIDIDAATEKGICFCNVHEYCTEEVATHALGMILSLNRKIPFFNDFVHDGGWFHMDGRLRSLKSSIIGIIGLGKISRSLILKLSNLCDNIWVASQHATLEEAAALGIQLKSFDEIIAKADYISVHVPSNEHTRHLFNKEVFDAMKPTASLINVARGAIVDEEALADALEKGSIAYAAIDVTDPEPICPDSRLLKLPNIIITPHTAWNSEEAIARLQTTVAQNVADVLTGKHPGKNLVNTELSYLFSIES